MLQFIEKKSSNSPDSAVIWMHGLGADGNDFADLPQAFNLPATKFIFPHAPTRPITLNGGIEMPGWYDILGLDMGSREDPQGVYLSAQQILTLIEQQCEGIRSERIILAGFSQGSAMALHIGLTTPKKFGGIIALSGYLPIRNQFHENRASINKDTPIFLAHGSQDLVVPFSFGQMTHQHLTEHGYPVEWREYPMPHTVVPEQIQDVKRWLGNILK